MNIDQFRNQLARLRFIDRDNLPDGVLWDEDWPSFRDNPFRYFLICSDEHQSDIWNALERDRVRTQYEHAQRLREALKVVLE